MPGRELLETTSVRELWGDHAVTLPSPSGGNVTTSCEVNPTPNMRDLFLHSTMEMYIGWVIAGGCATASVVLCVLHLHRLSTYENTARRKYFTGVIMMAPVFAVTNFLSMFFPRAAALFELVQHVFEAQALSSFGLLLFDLAADGETDYLVAREVLLAKLALCEPKKLDASPPLCFLAPCVKAVRVDGPRLDRLMAGLKVFGYVVPTCAIVRLWVTVEAKNSWVIDGSQIGLMLGMNVAMSYTLYCLFQLYVSTHDILHKFKPTDKFIAIKAILGIAVFQDMVIKTVMKKYVQEGYFTAEMLSEFWADFALCCEAILLALAHMTAYPILELADESGGAAARRVAAKTHALEVLAQPRASHGDEEAAEERGAPRIAVVEVNPLAKIPWTLDMDEQQWPASSEAALWGPHRPLADKSSTAATSSRLAHERQL